MSSTDRAAELRALADQLEEIGALEDAAQAAAQEHREAGTEGTRAAYRATQEELRAARKAARESGLMVSSGEPGSVAIQPSTVSGKVR